MPNQAQRSPLQRELVIVAIALLLTMAIGSVLMIIVGQSPAHVWTELVGRVVGDSYNRSQVLYRATTLVCTGVSVALALDVGLFKIAAEGQMTVGVLLAAVVGAALPPSTPAIVAVTVCLIAAFSGGALIGAAIATIKLRRGGNEVISSIMMNALIAAIALWLGNAVLFTPGTTTSSRIIAAAQLPILGDSTSAANLMAIIVVILVCTITILRHLTVWGQHWRLVGSSLPVARGLGVNTRRVQTLVLMLAGGFASLAAGNLVLGHHFAFEEGLGRGLGFFGIAVALIGRLQPLAIIVAALGLSVISVGGLAVSDLVPKELSELLMAVMIVAIAVAVPSVFATEYVRRLTENKP
jgi:general nucleoside transport system permease protein